MHHTSSLTILEYNILIPIYGRMIWHWSIFNRLSSNLKCIAFCCIQVMIRLNTIVTRKMSTFKHSKPSSGRSLNLCFASLGHLHLEMIRSLPYPIRILYINRLTAALVTIFCWWIFPVPSPDVRTHIIASSYHWRMLAMKIRHILSTHFIYYVFNVEFESWLSNHMII